MKLRNAKLNLVLFFIMNLIIIFSINYVKGKTVESKYGMSFNFVKLEKIFKDKKFLNLDFLLKYNDVKIVGELYEEKILGVYDPTMYYYINSSKVIDDSVKTRYFSMEDYKNKNNVGIAFLGKKFDNFKNIEIINSFAQSDNTFSTNIYNNDFNLVVNLFSVDNFSFDNIYIDSEKKEDIKLVKNEIKKLGYREADPFYNNDNSTIFKLIYDSFNNKYASFVIGGLITSFVLFCYSFFLEIQKYNKFIYLSLYYGATKEKIIKYCLEHIILCNVISFFFCIYI